MGTASSLSEGFIDGVTEHGGSNLRVEVTVTNVSGSKQVSVSMSVAHTQVAVSVAHTQDPLASLKSPTHV